jgi:hypothetical protein
MAPAGATVADRDVTWEELVRAGTVLFGPGFAAAVHAPGWRSGLREAWRRRVLETHPDRAAILGRSEAALQREFRAVTEAFALLESFAVGGEPLPPRAGPAVAPPRATRGSTPRAPSPPPRGAPPPRRAPPGPPPPRPPRAPPPPTAASAEAAGPRLPRRRLRFAEYLYYSGRISWQHYVAAVAWQRGQRPSLGRLAVDLGLLGHGDVTDLLERRRREGAQTEPLGQFAVRRGFLTRAQLLGLVGRQNQGQRRIGLYFLEQGLLTAAELEGAQLALFGHNARHAVKVA